MNNPVSRGIGFALNGVSALVETVVRLPVAGAFYLMFRGTNQMYQEAAQVDYNRRPGP